MKVRRLPRVLALTAVAVVAVVVGVQTAEGLRVAAREGVAPYQRFAGWVARLVAAGVAWRDVAAVGAENAALRRQLGVLQAQQALWRSQALEHAELRRHVDYVRAQSDLLVAEVLSRGGADGWSQRLRIGKGRAHGIRPNSPVLAPEGLVGRVVEVHRGTAEVLLITDRNSQVACRFEPDLPTARGILIGGGVRLAGPPTLALLHTVEPLHLAYLDKDVAVPERAQVVTSGLGGVYPPGLAVGTVRHTRPDASGLFQRAEVVPHVDFGALRHVLVLVRGGPPATEEGRAP